MDVVFILEWSYLSDRSSHLVKLGEASDDKQL